MSQNPIYDVLVLYTRDNSDRPTAANPLTIKYAKSFGISLISISLAALYFSLINANTIDIIVLSLIWSGYHGLVIWNNIIHYNKLDIIVHSLFLGVFSVLLTITLAVAI